MKAADLQRKEKSNGKIKSKISPFTRHWNAHVRKRKVLSRDEWKKDGQGVARTGNILNYFGSWSRMLTFLENEFPDMWKKLNAVPEVKKVSPKEAVKESPKAAPTAPVKKTVPTAKTEK